MTKPSLFAILSNAQVKRIDLGDKSVSLVGARDLVREGIEYALKHHKIGVLSSLGYFINNIITVREIFNLRDHSNSKIIYYDFKETPLFERLEKIKHGKLTLQSVLNPDLADVIIREIQSVIVSGFEYDLLVYKLEGISAYPNIGILPPNSSQDLVQRIEQPIKQLKIFFSICLVEAKSFDSVQRCIEYIQAYQNTGGGVGLSGVISSSNISNAILYHKYGAEFLKTLDMYGIKASVIQRFRERDVKITSFAEVTDALKLLYALNIASDNVALCQELLLTPYGRHTICLIKIFESDLKFFGSLVKLMPWEEGLQKLLYSNFHLEEYQVIHHILMHEKCLEIFKAIARNCDVESLVAIANLHITRWGDAMQISICDELADPDFCYIVLSRLQEVGELSQIPRDAIMEYCICMFDQMPVLSIIYTLQQGDIRLLLEEYFFVPNSMELLSIGEYLFSGKYENGKYILEIICETASPSDLMELIWCGREFVNKPGDGLEDSMCDEGVHSPKPGDIVRDFHDATVIGEGSI